MTNGLSAADNIGISVFSGVIAFVSDSWPQIFAVTFASVHAYIAIDKWLYERSQRKTD